VGQPVAPAPVGTLQAVLAHEPGHALATNPDVQPQAQLGMHVWCAVGGAAAGIDLADLLGKDRIGQRPGRRWPRGPGVVAGACHTQHAAQLGDPVVWLLRLDQPVAAHR
jgi:hypothetical protein